MKQGLYIIRDNEPLARGIYRMRLAGDTSALTAPGQFVNVALDGLFLRRPLSVCDWDEEGLTLIYKVVGTGTARMAAYRPGQALDLLTGLGNGYDLGRLTGRAALVGGGSGVPPLYGLAKRLIARGAPVTAILGFNGQADAFYEKEFAELGARVAVTTADGSRGLRGFVTDAPEIAQCDSLCACGPEPMLRAVWAVSPPNSFFSFEQRMGCGFGACMGCTCETLFGPKRACADGPVFEKGEIAWPTRA